MAAHRTFDPGHDSRRPSEERPFEERHQKGPVHGGVQKLPCNLHILVPLEQTFIIQSSNKQAIGETWKKKTSYRLITFLWWVLSSSSSLLFDSFLKWTIGTPSWTTKSSHCDLAIPSRSSMTANLRDLYPHIMSTIHTTAQQELRLHAPTITKLEIQQVLLTFIIVKKAVSMKWTTNKKLFMHKCNLFQTPPWQKGRGSFY